MTLTIPIYKLTNPFTIFASARAAQAEYAQAIADQTVAIATLSTIINERES